MNPSRGSRHFAALLAACALAALPPLAQELSAAGPDAVPEPAAFGTADLSVASISARAFVPLHSVIQSVFNEGRYIITAEGQMSAPLFLPDGALIEAIQMDACDTSASGETALALGVCPGAAADCTIAALVSTGGAATPGCGAFAAAVPLPYPVVANASNSYARLLPAPGLAGSRNRLVRRRSGGPPSPSIRGGAEILGDHRGVRGRKLLPERHGHARADGGVPREGTRAALGAVRRPRENGAGRFQTRARDRRDL